MAPRRSRPRQQRIEPSFDRPAPSRPQATGRPTGPVASQGAPNPQRRKTRRKPAKRRGGSRRRTGGGGGLGRFFGRMVYWSAVLGLWAVMGIAGVIAYHAMQLPPASEWRVPDRPPNVRIVANDGALLANRGDTGGEQIRVEELPAYLPQAVIAIEDRRFRNHFGLDPIGLARAMVVNAQAGRFVQGGSTITQQLAKNLFLTADRTISRKIQELILAVWLEATYSKDEIMELYLNRVYLGAGAYGVDAAARRYFGKAASQVTLAEAATLAGLLRAPSRWAPTRNPEGAEARAATVLQAMVEAGFITTEEAALARSNPAATVDRMRRGAANYVADAVMDELDRLIDVVDGDITVETTVDPYLQSRAELALRGALGAQDDTELQGAIVSVDGTGAIRAMVGGRDYGQSQFNRATRAFRQPGSAFKPFVYLAALEGGLTPSSLRIDQPVSFGGWSPVNYSREYRGPVTLADALALSLNTVAAQLAHEVGPARVINVAERLGIESDMERNASIALGTSEVSPTELTGAYAAFANGGYAIDPHLIVRVRDEEGRVLFSRDGTGFGQVIAPHHVRAMNAMLSRTLIIGTGRRAALETWTGAGKTGTTQGLRDAWFVGYTANLTTGVWIGKDDNTPMDGITGGGVPSQVWQAYMTDAHIGVPIAMLPGTDAQSLAALNPAAIIGNQAIPGVGVGGVPEAVPQLQMPQSVGRHSDPEDRSSPVLPDASQPSPLARFLGSIF
ncbi:MAG: PBP1A family penicillin-binding protein [Devosiaceae bacterium]|nr:PBP1A family penicillin-binding protein [Devosiaceae bacterium MH13]